MFILFILIIFLFSFFQSSNNYQKNIVINKKTSDISKPKFTINSEKQKISVTASEGNFLTDDEIVLEKNVVFKSNKFKIFTDTVVFLSLPKNLEFIGLFKANDILI